MKRLSIKIFSIFLLSILFILIGYRVFFALLQGFVPSDGELIQQFEKKRSTFSELANIIEKYDREGVICPGDYGPSSPFITHDLVICQQKLHDIGTKSCTVIEKEGKNITIKILMWARGMLSEGPSKGYFFTSDTINTTVPNLDIFAREGMFDTEFDNNTGIHFRRIDQHWYLFYEHG